MLFAHVVELVSVMGVLVVSGCGGSSNGGSSASTVTSAASTSTSVADEASSKPSGKPLSRSELIAQGDAICYRLNARRSSSTISRPQDYERIVPPLAAYELVATNEMAHLIPPASMARDWRRMVAGSRTIAEATGRFRTYTEAKTGKLAREIDLILGQGIDELVHAAKHAGFKDCSHFA